MANKKDNTKKQKRKDVIPKKKKSRMGENAVFEY